MMLGAGFIHGDPHPGNIFLMEGARVALIDCLSFRTLRVYATTAVAARRLGYKHNTYVRRTCTGEFNTNPRWQLTLRWASKLLDAKQISKDFACS